MSQGRAHVCDAMEASGEFQTLVSTLYGTATSDNQRTEQIVNNFYLGAYGRNATSTELQTERDALNAAAAQGVASVQSALETFGRGLFAAQVTDGSITNQQFVTNVYEAFLQRGPDTAGLNFWSSGTKQWALDGMAASTAFRDLAATLYREEFWLVDDHLGTPRMIVDKSGSLSGIKRHDYLPFGEEISAGIGSRATGQGYTGDSTRQHFTGYEMDGESGLNFAQARYQSSTQGRFTSVDPLGASASVYDPQSLNRYSYVNNDPVNAVDPSGMMLSDIGVYQTDNAASARYEEDNATWHTLRSATRTGPPTSQSYSTRWAASATLETAASLSSAAFSQGSQIDVQNLDERTKIFVAVGLGEGTGFDVGSGDIDGYPSLSFDQLPKEQKSGSSIHFAGLGALKQLRDESYFIISALMNDVSDGRYKTLEGAANGEAVGYVTGVGRLNQLDSPMYNIRARLMIEQLRNIDASGPNDYVRFWRGVQQPGGQRAYREGDIRAGNTDFMRISPLTKAYDRLPYWTVNGWKTPRR